MARLHLALLGPLYVTLDEQPVDSLGYDKVRALLVYLALEAHRAHDRSALAALLWPGEMGSVARKNLRTALATLRQAIDDAAATPPFLHITRDTIQFNRFSDYTLDVSAFAALLAEVERHNHGQAAPCSTCAHTLAQAAALYRGEFAQHLEIAHSNLWEEWVLLIRERLHRRMRDTLAQLMAFHEANNEDEHARHYAWRALELEAWDEAAHRCLMRIFAHSGQRNAALTHYDRCCQILEKELGVGPAAETATLYERIRSGALERTIGRPPSAVASSVGPAVAQPTRAVPLQFTDWRMTNLPIQPTPLIGREAATTAAAARLLQPRVRLLTLIGPPGIGKTRLGLELAAMLQNAFADGICFVELAPIRDPALVLVAVAQALGLKADGTRSLVHVLASCLHNKALLLVLDNCEHLLAAAPSMADLLSTCPKLKILATSRAALRVRAECQFLVPPLDLPDPLHLNDMDAITSSPAVALFIERAQAITPMFDVDANNAATIAAICIQLDGLPLAIELAAACCNVLSLQTLFQRLQNRLTLLTTGSCDYPTRQQTLRDEIDWSYRLLPHNAQVLFARLALFTGDFTLPMLAAIGLDGDDHLSATFDALTTLVNNSLVQQLPDAGDERRFRLLNTLREYAYERLHEQGETASYAIATRLNCFNWQNRNWESEQRPGHIRVCRTLSYRRSHAVSAGE